MIEVQIFCATMKYYCKVCDCVLLNGLRSSESQRINALHCDYFHLCKPTGNTRVISQNALQSFQDEMGKVLNDPYKVFEHDSHWSALMK